MYSSYVQMESALNEFFKTQAAVEGVCLVDYAQFSAGYPNWGARHLQENNNTANGFQMVYTDRPVAEATAVINPGGGTALLDAIGTGVTNLGAKLKKMPEARRPGRVLVVVVTDGEENSSRTWSDVAVKQLVESQTNDYDWDFVFLGANIDAVETGGQYGFKADKSMTFNINDGESIIATSAALSSYTTTLRGVQGSKGAAFSDSDRAAANK